MGAEAKVPQVHRFTAYHISRHVVGTFNACHSTTTPLDLNSFSTTQTGQNHRAINMALDQSPSVILMIPKEDRNSNLHLVSGRKSTRLLSNPIKQGASD
jgi:hypothetical protein